MSNLWTQSMAWWNAHPDEADTYAGREREPMHSRRERFISQVVDKHNVPRDRAEHALRHTVRRLGTGEQGDPMHYGFRSVRHGTMAEDHYTTHEVDIFRDPKTWAGKQVTQVPTDRVHATQDWIRPRSIAHNLFHPGQKESPSDDEIGDPDFDPDDLRDGMDEEDDDEKAWHALSHVPRMLQRQNGDHEVIDGHHRVATDLLLGKSHTPAMVMHERELDERSAMNALRRKS